MLKSRSMIVLLLLGISSSSASEHMVSSAAEFGTALSSVRPGDEVIFKNGLWRDVQLNFRAKGTPEQPITVRAESPGKVIFEGSSRLIIDGPHLVVSGFKFQNISNLSETVTPDTVRVRRVVLFTTNAFQSRLTETAIVDSGLGVTTYVHLQPGSVSNRVDHCFFSGQQGNGVTFYVEAHPTRPNWHLVDYNYFGDRKPGRGNGWETMRIGHSAQQEFVSGTTVTHNYFYRCNGEIECISNKSTGNRYLYNSFIENQGQLSLRHGNKATIEGNYFFGGDEPASQGVRASGSDHRIINNYFKAVHDALLIYNGQPNPEPTGYAVVSNCWVAFNTFQDCINNLALGVGERGRTLTPQRLRIVGNLVRARSGNIIQCKSAGIDVQYEDNIMFGAELGIDQNSGISNRKPPTRTDQWGRLFPEGAESIIRFDPPRKPSLAAPGFESMSRNVAVGAVADPGRAPLYPLSKDDVGPAWMKQGAR